MYKDEVEYVVVSFNEPDFKFSFHLKINFWEKRYEKYKDLTKTINDFYHEFLEQVETTIKKSDWSWWDEEIDGKVLQYRDKGKWDVNDVKTCSQEEFRKLLESENPE